MGSHINIYVLCFHVAGDLRYKILFSASAKDLWAEILHLLRSLHLRRVCACRGNCLSVPS